MQSWIPWDTDLVWNPIEVSKQRRYEKSCNFLRQIPAQYEKMRADVQENEEFYSRTRFEAFNNYDIRELCLIWNEFGWPSEENFDAKCAIGAWIIAQHADHNPVFQQKVLWTLGKINTPLALQHYAFLIDRIKVNKGELQLYGTQLNEQGLLYNIAAEIDPNLEPSEATAQVFAIVNNRREAVGFCPLEDSQEYKLHTINSEISEFLKYRALS